ncbi:MAG: MCP four helix bundle domain-containing protein [Gammaproteobacteria bacterium]|nr:MCP four helix bundle domain-containing protein [Gammaproteobacteria bacterium]MBU1491657.1 MCP four helix bundle domain-containing protein [Gammaproteobacteria bacterium]MBU2140756.1 MCP four helix bundle domain-containing protein [Gammaproteobacteria bacterium]MBU2215679.1 MCP four helix bundle domain-containing protein [Gammaproteobacteria bacterium]MBU2322576.1 MCP four helix bundle domain-containing protein [Gammaproteobacteria bacterium]
MPSNTPRLSTRTTLYAGYASLLALMLVIATVSLYNLADSNKDFSSYVTGVDTRARLANELNNAAKDRAIALRNLALNSNVATRGQQRAAIESHEKTVVSSLAALRQAVTSHDGVSATGRDMFSRIEQVESRYNPVAHTIAEHLFNGEDAQALRMVSEQCTPLLEELTQVIGEYLNHTNEVADEMVAHNEAHYQQQRNLLITITALAFLLACVLGHWISRNLLRALGAEPSELNQLAQRVAQGDLRISQRKAEPPQDSVLAALLRMQQNLREMTRGIEASSQVVAQSSQELSQSSLRNSDNVAHAQREVELIVTAVHEMAATVQDVARNAESAAGAASEADSAALYSQQKAKDAVNLIGDLAEVIGQSNVAMGRLKDESNNIGSVLDVIKSVADQTNLLALNAAIEAARAGDAGRGFAVVADEVRSLARRTQQATSEIEGLIAGLQKIADETSQYMQRCQRSSEQSVSGVSEAGEAVTRIVSMIERINSMNQQIAAASEEQSAVAEQISQGVVAVRDSSEQSAAAFRSAQQESESLSRTSVALRENISRFQL